eukprot:2106171-Pleurochrysis_carterae.AAC.1
MGIYIIYVGMCCAPSGQLSRAFLTDHPCERPQYLKFTFACVVLSFHMLKEAQKRPPVTAHSTGQAILKCPEIVPARAATSPNRNIFYSRLNNGLNVPISPSNVKLLASATRA